MRYFDRYLPADSTENLSPELIREKGFSLFKRFDLVYLFGSLAKGRRTPLSDIDLGFLVNRKVDLFNTRIDLIGKLTEILHEEVDVVILDTAPPLLKFEVLKGILLFQRDERLRIEFEVKARNEYYDTNYLRRVQSQYLFARIEGT